MTTEETLLKKTELGRVDMRFSWNNFLAVLLAVILCYFGHPILGAIIAFFIWEYPDKRSNDSDEIEYEVHDDEE